MRALKVCVEKAVRPVRASQRRKFAMREELLSHLMDIYKQEFARSGNEQAAVAAALRRFGAPSALTRELQQTVPRLEQMLCWPVPGLAIVDSIGHIRLRPRKPNESLERCAVRNFALLILLATAIPAVVVVVLLLLRMCQNDAYPALAELRVLLGCAMVAELALALWLFPGAATRLDDVVLVVSGSHRAALRAGAHVALLGLTLFATGVMFLLAMKRSGLYAEWHVYGLALFALVAPGALGSFARLVARDARRHTEWLQLDIAD